MILKNKELKKTSILFLYVVLNISFAFGQLSNLPFKEWDSSTQKPFIFYISGDGGLNDFSTGLCSELNKSGYSISALNAKVYFWDKKTPAQAAKDITSYIQKKISSKKNKQWILAGYSFGADVLPFIINQIPDSVRQNLIAAILLSPSTTTDFEIHIFDILGGNKKRSMDVVAEINKMGSQKTIIISGAEETDFPFEKILLKNFRKELIPGKHHFNYDLKKIAGIIIDSAT